MKTSQLACIVLAAALSLCCALAALPAAADAGASTTDAAALSKARATGNKKRAQKVFYTKQFDLSGLAPYKPEQPVKGVIRQWGDNYLKDSGLIDLWETQFRGFHSEASFDDNLASSSVAFPGLITGAADLAPLGRQALWDELKGFEREGAGTGGEGDTGDEEVVEVVVATGSYDVRGWTFALGVFVNKDNPIAHLTMEQLDGIFGAERSGGWNGLTWEPARARGPERNIRTWGQLGLKGEWAGQEIHTHGYVAPGSSDKYVELNLDNVQNRSYPLLRDVYYYVKRRKGQPLDPKVKEFLRYILSREGQSQVQRDGKYLPLTAEVAREQLKKLD